jgi:hypothetical protein
MAAASMKHTLLRTALLLLLGVALMAIYFWINQNAFTPHKQVTMPEWVPFWPVLAMPYLGMLVIPWFMALGIQDRVRFRQCLCAIVLAYSVIAAIWILFPTKMHRPTVPDGWQYDLYRQMISADKPVNIFPCGHIMSPLVVTFFLAEERKSWLLWLLVLPALGSVTIMTTWQHRPIDIVTGAAISLLAIWICRKVRPVDQHVPTR